MTIGCADNLYSHFHTGLDNIIVAEMLLGNIIPLDFSVEPVTEDLLELSDGIPHSGEHMVWALVSVLPKVSKEWTRHTSSANDKPLVILVQHLKVHTRIPIKVFRLVAIRDELE